MMPKVRCKRSPGAKSSPTNGRATAAASSPAPGTAGCSRRGSRRRARRWPNSRRRRAANEWYDHTLYSRLNDKARSAVLLVMHRLHEDDLTGNVLAQEDWEVVRFPAIAETDETHRIETLAGPLAFSRGQGEALHPARESLAMLAGIRRTIGEYPPDTSFRRLPASTSRLRRRSAAAWSSPPGSGAIGRRNCRPPSSASCRAGTPPTRRASSPISASAPAGG